VNHPPHPSGRCTSTGATRGSPRPASGAPTRRQQQQRARSGHDRPDAAPLPGAPPTVVLREADRAASAKTSARGRWGRSVQPPQRSHCARWRPRERAADFGARKGLTDGCPIRADSPHPSAPETLAPARGGSRRIACKKNAAAHEGAASAKTAMAAVPAAGRDPPLARPTRN